MEYLSIVVSEDDVPTMLGGTFMLQDRVNIYAPQFVGRKPALSWMPVQESLDVGVFAPE